MDLLLLFLEDEEEEKSPLPLEEVAEVLLAPGAMLISSPMEAPLGVRFIPREKRLSLMRVMPMVHHIRSYTGGYIGTRCRCPFGVPGTI